MTGQITNRRLHGSKPLPLTIAQAVLEARGVDRDGYTFLNARLDARTWTWNHVATGAVRRAQTLRTRGVAPGERVGIIAEDNESFVLWFLGSVVAGAVAVPIQTPLPTSSEQAYVDHVARMLRSADAEWLLCSARLANVSEALRLRVPSLRAVLAAESVRDDGCADVDAEPDSIAEPDQTCFLQFTSGSTSDPRGVQVTHRNLIENIDAAQRRNRAHPDHDVGVSWLPLYHDFGLIGSILTPLLSLGRSILIPTVAFATRPRIWLEVVHRYRATMTASTNFGLRLATKRMPQLADLNLSSLRLITIGAEPIQPSVVRAFVAAYGGAGLREGVVCPCYGLAESTLAVTVPDPGSPLKTRTVVAATGPTREPLEAVSCGRPLDGHELRIADTEDRALTDGEVGEIEVRGPSVTPGYFRNPDANSQLFTRESWLKTGDLGFVHDGELYVCGRLKDLIIVQGRNYHPHQIEWEASQIPGVRRDCVVAFGVPGDGTEKLVIAAECQNPDRTAGLAREIRVRVAARIGLNARDVVLLRPWTLSKTSSGKLQRRRTREQYLSGALASAVVAESSADNRRV